jgi:hypothetical protein
MTTIIAATIRITTHNYNGIPEKNDKIKGLRASAGIFKKNPTFSFFFSYFFSFLSDIFMLSREASK